MSLTMNQLEKQAGYVEIKSIYESLAESNKRHNELFNKDSINEEIHSKLNDYIKIIP